MLKYKTSFDFKIEDVVKLFESHNWISAKFPTRLYKALMNSSYVISVYDEDKLVGLSRVIDDTELVAYVHYVIVMKGYEKRGIASNMLKMIKEKYHNYLYIKVIPTDSNVVDFYKKNGFTVKADGVAMQIVNYTDRR